MHTTKSWATLVCSAVLMGGGVLGAAGTASASGLECGTLAQPAVYSTVTHPAVAAVVDIDTVIDVAAKAAEPAETHVEHQFSKVVPAVPAKYRYAKVVSHDAVQHTEYRWSVLTRQDQYRWSTLTRSLVPAVDAVTHVESKWKHPVYHSHPEYQIGHKVIDTPASPAVTHSEWLWTTTTPAVPETTHTEWIWTREVPGETHTQTQRSATSPGAGWTKSDGTAVTTVSPGGYAYVNKHGGIKYQDSPNWNGGGDHGHDNGWNRLPSADKTTTTWDWTKTTTDQGTREFSGYSATAPGAGWEKTHTSREVGNGDGKPAETTTTEKTSAVPPSAVGWTKVDGSEVTITDQAAVPEKSHTETRWILDRDTETPKGWFYLGKRTVQDETTYDYQWTKNDANGDKVKPDSQGPWWYLGQKTVEDSPAVPASYTNWRWTKYTDWGTSTTPPEATDTVKYDSRYHQFSNWKWTRYTDWQESTTPPALTDDLTSYDSKYTRTVTDEKAYDETVYYNGTPGNTTDAGSAAYVAYTPTGGWSQFGDPQEGTGTAEYTLFYTGKPAGSQNKADGAWVQYVPSGGWSQADERTVTDKPAWNTIQFGYFAEPPANGTYGPDQLATTDWAATGKTQSVVDGTERETGWSQDLAVSPWQGSDNRGWFSGQKFDHTDWFYTAPDTSVNAWVATGEEKDPEFFYNGDGSAPDATPVGDGWWKSGQQWEIPADVTMTEETSEVPPSAVGWTKVPYSEVTITDQEAIPAVEEQSHEVTTIASPAVPAWDEQVLVSAAVPATDNCPATLPGDGPVSSDPVTGDPVTISPAVGEPATAAPASAVAAPSVAAAQPAVSRVAATAPRSAAPAEVSSTARSNGDHQLAFTGADSATVAAGGFLMTLLGGLLLLVRPRRRRSE